MTDKMEPSIQLDDTEILLLKEKEEKNILKETLSQKDETIENLKRCLQLYQNGLKDYPFNVEAVHNDDFKEGFTNNQGILTTGRSEIKLDDIIIDDDVDDLVNFVNKDLLGEEHFLKELDVSFDVDSSEIVKLEDNIDINDLATFSGYSFGGLSEEYSNDDVVSEIMSSPLDGFSLKCADKNIKESGNSNGLTIDRNSLDSLLPETMTSAIRKSMTGKSMKKMIPREFPTETTVEEEVITVEDDLLDILDSSSDMCGGVPPLEQMALKDPTKETPKGRMKRQSDIWVTDSAKKWLVEKNSCKDDKQSSRKEKNLESSIKMYGKKDCSSEPFKLKKKGSKSAQSNTVGKDTTGTVQYKMVDCSKCGVAFPMDRKQILNSFYMPGCPRCSDCQASPKEKGEKAKPNFMSRTKLETAQASGKMGNFYKKSHDKINPFSAQSFHQTERKVTTNKSHIRCEVCGKQFPMGGEWKYRKHMDVHMKGKRQATANVDVDVKIHPVEIITERKKPVQLKRELKKCEEYVKEMKKGEGASVEMKIMKEQVAYKTHVKGKQEANACNVCQESFKYKSTLLAHMKTHKSNYPFRCNLCNKYFKQIDDMVNHGVLEHNKKSVGNLLALLGRGTK